MKLQPKGRPKKRRRRDKDLKPLQRRRLRDRKQKPPLL